jgi:perosamine synthetase
VIPHNRPTLGEEEETAALRVLHSKWLAQGTEVENFENEICRFLGLPDGHAIAVSSGTAALFLALWAIQAKGRRVGLTAYACSALRHSVKMANAQEVLFDIQEGTPNIDLDSLARSDIEIAIVPHIYGIPCDLSRLPKNISVIEDCAQALGSSLGGIPSGLQGHVGVFSFYATKLITSGGQGGMIVSKDKTLLDSIRDYREFDCRKDSNDRFNFQMTDLQAAIGREQLKKLPGFLERREKIFQLYREAGLDLLGPPSISGEVKPVRYRAVLLTPHQRKTLARLAEAQIKAINPIEDWELLGPAKNFPFASEMIRKTVSLPLYPSLKDEEVQFIISKAHLK